MFTLALIGLVGGLITGISPCILPVLSVTSFALAGSLLISLLGLPGNVLRVTGGGAFLLGVVLTP
jgi:cytochrome c biogenesis protein CcdA